MSDDFLNSATLDDSPEITKATGLEKQINIYLESIADKRLEILERFAEAYLADTGLKPSEVELCQQSRGNKIVWWFQKRGKT